MKLQPTKTISVDYPVYEFSVLKGKFLTISFIELSKNVLVVNYIKLHKKVKDLLKEAESKFPNSLSTFLDSLFTFESADFQFYLGTTGSAFAVGNSWNLPQLEFSELKELSVNSFFDSDVLQEREIDLYRGATTVRWLKKFKAELALWDKHLAKVDFTKLPELVKEHQIQNLLKQISNLQYQTNAIEKSLESNKTLLKKYQKELQTLQGSADVKSTEGEKNV